MTDQRFTELLSRKLSDDILADEEQELMLLLAENEEYKNEYEALNGYFQEETEEPVSLSFERIKERIQPAAAPVKTIKRSLMTIYRIAAVLLLGILSFTAYRFFQSKRSTDQLISGSLNKLSSAGKKQAKIVLTDGTEVILNAESELKYPASFNGETREVYLSGEAFFEVAKDKKHPFIVHTEKMAVKVLGTAFDLKSYKNDPATEATLIHGSIQITLNAEPENKIMLKPEEKFVLTHAAEGKKETAANYNITPFRYFNAEDKNSLIETSWMNNKLVFKNETFAVLSLNMSRWYGVEFVFKSEKLKQNKFTGIFEKESLTEALKALQLIAPFEYKTEGKTIYLYTQN